MIIVRLLSPEPLVGQHHQLYSATGADIVMESIAQVSETGQDDECNRLWLLKNSLYPKIDSKWVTRNVYPVGESRL
jgi:hypothetical protein